MCFCRFFSCFNFFHVRWKIEETLGTWEKDNKETVRTPDSHTHRHKEKKTRRDYSFLFFHLSLFLLHIFLDYTKSMLFPYPMFFLLPFSQGSSLSSHRLSLRLNFGNSPLLVWILHLLSVFLSSSLEIHFQAARGFLQMRDSYHPNHPSGHFHRHFPGFGAASCPGLPKTLQVGRPSNPSNPSKRRREGSTEPPETPEVSHRISSLCASHDGQLIACGRDSGGKGWEGSDLGGWPIVSGKEFDI